MKKRFAIPILLVLLIFVTGCNRAGGSKAKEGKQIVTTHKVSTSEVTTYIEATGSVQPDLEGSSRILPYLGGSVQKIFIKVGDSVKKGDPLVSIVCPEVTDSYASYLGALAQLKQAERIFKLNQELFEIGAVTKNDLLTSESTYQQLTAAVDGLKSKLRVYGYSAHENAVVKKPASDTVLIKAPMAGYVADIQAHMGDKVDPSSPLMTIADPRNIVIVANIYDTDVYRVEKGKNVIFHVDAFRDMSFRGVITYVSDISDTESKTVKAFIKMSEKKEMFKQNMFLKLRIEDQKKRLPMIPQSAMVYREGKFYVYVPLDVESWELKEIKPFHEVSGKYMAVEGLREGDTIVLSAIELERP